MFLNRRRQFFFCFCFFNSVSLGSVSGTLSGD